MTGFEDLGKMLVLFGAFFIGVGVLVLALGKLGSFGFGRLPGDIVIERENISCFFPLTSMLILSLVLTVLLNLLARLLGR